MVMALWPTKEIQDQMWAISVLLASWCKFLYPKEQSLRHLWAKTFRRLVDLRWNGLVFWFVLMITRARRLPVTGHCVARKLWIQDLYKLFFLCHSSNESGGYPSYTDTSPSGRRTYGGLSSVSNTTCWRYKHEKQSKLEVNGLPSSQELRVDYRSQTQTDGSTLAYPKD